MLQKDLVINNETGLHARPAALFVEIANRFDVKVELTFDETTVNGKSIIGVLSLGIGKGNKITLTIDGPDEKEAMAALEEIINNKFNEIR